MYMDDLVSDKVKNFFSTYPLRSYPKGQIITYAEEEPQGVLYMLEGRINQYDIAPNGSEVVVNIFKPPAFLPMSWAINKAPNHYFFEAAAATKAHQAPAEDTVQFLKNNPDVAFDLLSRVYRGVDGLLRRTSHLMAGDASSRLLFELLNAAYRFGQPNEKGEIVISLKEGDLAKHSGLARETVNRMLQKLKQTNLVRVEGGRIIIPSTADLETALGRNL